MGGYWWYFLFRSIIDINYRLKDTYFLPTIKFCNLGLDPFETNMRKLTISSHRTQYDIYHMRGSTLNRTAKNKRHCYLDQSRVAGLFESALFLWLIMKIFRSKTLHLHWKVYVGFFGQWMGEKRNHLKGEMSMFVGNYGVNSVINIKKFKKK